MFNRSKCPIMTIHLIHFDPHLDQKYIGLQVLLPKMNEENNIASLIELFSGGPLSKTDCLKNIDNYKRLIKLLFEETLKKIRLTSSLASLFQSHFYALQIADPNLSDPYLAVKFFEMYVALMDDCYATRLGCLKFNDQIRGQEVFLADSLFHSSDLQLPYQLKKGDHKDCRFTAASLMGIRLLDKKSNYVFRKSNKVSK